MTRRRLLGPLGARLALAFVAVALAAVAVLAGLTAIATRSEVAELVHEQRRARARAVAAAAAQAYELTDGWANADLSSVATLAAAADAQLEVRDSDGQQIALSPAHEEMMGDLAGRMHVGMGSMPQVAATDLGVAVSAEVRSNGDLVGKILLRFAANGLPEPEREVRDAMLRNVAASAGLAAAVALGVAVFVSRRLSRPLTRLVSGARAIESGDLGARVELAGAPGELGELGAAFDRMADSLTREDALRRALVADVAHELRTPITILQASCEAMVDGVDAPTRERLASLHDEVLRLGRLVEDLETLAAAEAASLRLDRRRVDLADIATDAIASLASRAADAELRVDTALDSAIVHGDARRLHQVAMNLLANAVKFTPAGGMVRVTTDTEGPFAVLEIADTGIGIAPDEIGSVFDRFWRGRGTGFTSGSGIGLAVVAELVRAHDGRVEVSSAAGEGARFRVLLPRP